MKDSPDDFERKIQRQPWREIPAEWRGEILAHCDAQSSSTQSLTSGWKDWLWPSPLAWGALAAVWLGILAIERSAVRSDEAPLARSNPARTESDTPPFFALYEQQRALSEILQASH